MSALVTVIRDRYVLGSPAHEQGEPAHLITLSRALSRSYTTDAHFAVYRTPNARRLTSAAPQVLGGVELTAILFDVDCADVHGTSEPAPEAWRSDLRERFAALQVDHPGGYFYETRGGARIVYEQPAPTVLRTDDDARTWKRGYAVALAYLERRFGIVADPACSDWTRLFRAPRATRTPGGAPEQWPTIGDVEHIGALTIDATTADVGLARSRSKAFDVPRVLPVGSSTLSDGRGLLFHALRSRGDVGAERADGGIVIRCPNERQHSTGRSGDGSTVLYPPKAGGEIGAICCLHAHCVDLRVRDWLAMFAEHELDDARRTAGIAARGRAA